MMIRNWRIEIIGSGRAAAPDTAIDPEEAIMRAAVSCSSAATAIAVIRLGGGLRRE
jgi:hypothetical protein